MSTPNSKLSGKKRSLSDINDNDTPPSKKHKTNTNSPIISKTIDTLSLNQFDSLAAKDIIKTISQQSSESLISNINTYIAQIIAKKEEIEQQIAMYQSANIPNNEIEPLFLRKTELYIIETTLNDLKSFNPQPTTTPTYTNSNNSNNNSNNNTNTNNSNSNTNNNTNTNNHNSNNSNYESKMEIDEESMDDKSMDSTNTNTNNDGILGQLLEMEIPLELANKSIQHRIENNEPVNIDACLDYIFENFSDELDNIINSQHEQEEEIYDNDNDIQLIITSDNKENTNPNTSTNTSNTSNTSDISSEIVNSDSNNNISLKPNIKCECCKTKWRLANIEWYTANKLCNNCPNINILQLYNPLNKAFTCPQCIHYGHLKIQKLTNDCNYSGINNNNILPILNTLQNSQCLYVQIKPHQHFQLIRITNGLNGIKYEQICNKKNKKCIQINLDLNSIVCNDNLWSYCPQRRGKQGYDTLNSSAVIRVINCTDDNTIYTIKTNNKSKLEVKMEQIMHTKKWLDYVVKIEKKALKAKKIKFDSDSIFKYSTKISKKKGKYSKQQVQIVESAPVNSRYFNDNQNQSNNQIQSNNNVQNETENIYWQCTTCTLINTKNKYKCEVCEFDREMDEENDIQIQNNNGNNNSNITNELANKLNININNNSSGNRPPDYDISFADISGYPIVLILGESGSGKSTLMNKLYNENKELITLLDANILQWNNNKGIISQFIENDTDKIIEYMSSIGLNSVPTWLKPPNTLSNGEKYRAEFSRGLAMALRNSIKSIMIDEFTSVLDRQNARCIATSISKFIRNKRNNNESIGQFIVASSKSDIIPYLQPDIVISLSGNNKYEIIENPNDLRYKCNYIPDIKVRVDLPAFNVVRQYRQSLYERNNNIFKSVLNIKKEINIKHKVSRLQCQIELDQHTEIVSSVFDVKFDGKITTDIAYLEREHIPNVFDVGIIYGPSGSGKTTTGERLFGRINTPEWNNDMRICQHFNSLEEMEEKFEAVNLSLILGLSYYFQLSQGEKDRINIARCLGYDNILIDEFTSNLDRYTAKRLAIGVRKYILNNKNKGIVLLSCHCDFIKELAPNWMFDIENKKVLHYNITDSDMSMDIDSSCDIKTKIHSFIDEKNMFTKPVIRLSLQPTYYTDFHPKFSKYHYMTADISVCALCFTVWATFNGGNEELVGFISVMQNPFVANMDGDHKFHYREHRTVILPAYQGLGFGSRICDAVAYYLSLYGKRLQSKTAHPRYGRYRDRSPLWIPLSTNGESKKRNSWQNQSQRVMGQRRETEEKFKVFYSHVFKLEYQRSKQDQEYLEQRVDV